LAQLIPLDGIVCGGDFSENGPKEEVVRSQRAIVNALRVPQCPLLSVKGNHDDNSIHDFHNKMGSTDHVIFPIESYEDLLKPLEGTVVFDKGNECGLYYYYDIPHKNTRVVILNSIDIPYITTDSGALRHNGQWEYAFSERQLDWVERKVFNFSGKPNGDTWKVVIFSHVAILQSGVHGADHEVANGEAMWKIIRANREYVVACFFGHVHYDQVQIRDGIPMISTLNAVSYKDFDECPERVKETISETAFDIISINYAKGELTATRFGAGEDRSVSI
jgi:3',5'-cyclic AMP phosphodiesterase CpdA